MMHRIYIIALMALLSSCGNEVEPGTTTQSVPGSEQEQIGIVGDTVCYLLSEGLVNKDTTIVHLIITGNNTVSGDITYLPYEKDRRAGPITGLKTGDHIRAQWLYMQEGMTDSMTITFRMNDDMLTQQQSTFDEHTGKEYFPNNAAYSRYYKRVDCNTAAGITDRY